jgi:hypothetical protein
MRPKLSLAFAGVVALAGAAVAGPPSGAIFTTLSDGSRVDANIYAAKTEVYLDGGPGAGAPSSAAALDEGWYVFQVTEPAGKVLLSTDSVRARRFHVNAQGLIDVVVNHATGADADHGALTVQLMPYLDTPNAGGEYKVWVTPIDRYSPGEGNFGFVGKYTKTDAFKVRAPEPPACCGCDCYCK